MPSKFHPELRKRPPGDHDHPPIETARHKRSRDEQAVHRSRAKRFNIRPTGGLYGCEFPDRLREIPPAPLVPVANRLLATPDQVLHRLGCAEIVQEPPEGKRPGDLGREVFQQDGRAQRVIPLVRRENYSNWPVVAIVQRLAALLEPLYDPLRAQRGDLLGLPNGREALREALGEVHEVRGIRPRQPRIKHSLVDHRPARPMRARRLKRVEVPRTRDLAKCVWGQRADHHLVRWIRDRRCE